MPIFAPRLPGPRTTGIRMADEPVAVPNGGSAKRVHALPQKPEPDPTLRTGRSRQVIHGPETSAVAAGARAGKLPVLHPQQG